MNAKNLYCAIISLVLLWSCGKDDGTTPAPEKNSAPKIEAQSFTVAEDISDTATIGTVKAEDPDEDELTFSISTNDNGMFQISGEGQLSLTVGNTLDFETDNQYAISVTVYDNINEPVEIEVTINVENVAEAIPEDSTAFVTTWKTTEDGEAIRIGLVEAYEYDFTINWGDGNIENVSTVPLDHLQAVDHDYEVAGDYTVSIIGELPGVVMGIFGAQINLMSIEQWGGIHWKTMASAYAYCENVVCKATDVPDLSQVTSLRYMFSFAHQFEGGLSGWNVSNIEDMTGLFYVTNFNGDISNWNIQNLKTMEFMFAHSPFNGDISGWKTDKVTNMRAVFLSNTAFNGDITNWDTGSVINMSQMFANSSFNGDISNWNIENATNLWMMFKNNNYFNCDISGWSTENVLYMGSMFEGATLFNQNLGDWNIESVIDMVNMLNNSGMTNANYENTLIGWVNNPNTNTPSNINLGAYGLSFCLGSAGEAARNNLINDYSWTITDAGSIACQP